MHSIWYVKLLARLEQKQEDSVKHILGGGAQDFPSYRYHVGYLDGLKEALYQAEEIDNEMIGVRPSEQRRQE